MAVSTGEKHAAHTLFFCSLQVLQPLLRGTPTIAAVVQLLVMLLMADGQLGDKTEWLGKYLLKNSVRAGSVQFGRGRLTCARTM
jgi:hypothetical protein